MASGSSRLFVGNLADQVTEDLLYELFLQVGPVKKVIRPNRNGQVAKFAFVDFVHTESVSYAIQVVKGVTLFGEELWLKGPNSSENRNTYIEPTSRSPSRDRTRNSYILPASGSPSGDHQHRSRSPVSPCSSQSSHTSSSRGRTESHRVQDRSCSKDRSRRPQWSHHSSQRFHDSPKRSRHHPYLPNRRPDRSHERQNGPRHSRDRSHHDPDQDQRNYRHSYQARSRSSSKEDRNERHCLSSHIAVSSERERNKGEKRDNSANELMRSHPVHHLQKEQPDMPYSVHEMGPEGDYIPQNFHTNSDSDKQLNSQEFMKKTAIYRWSASDKQQ